jgi:hypothetical protein
MARGLGPMPGAKDAWHLRQFHRRADYVLRAWTMAADQFLMRAMIRRSGREYYEIMKEMLPTLSVALGAFIVTVLLGIMMGGAIGGLVGGIAAAPGAVMGAKAGFVVCTFILNLFGVAYLGPLFRHKMGIVGERLCEGIAKAWDSEGRDLVIEDAARDMAEAVAMFYQFLLEAFIHFLNETAQYGDMVVAMRNFRNTRLFRICGRLELWLTRNFGEFRATYIPFEWRVVGTGPMMAGTSKPAWTRLQVGRREFFIEHTPETPPASEKDTDAPIKPKTPIEYSLGALAVALDAAEADLIFKSAQPRAKPDVDGWNLVIDTRPAIWKVHYAEALKAPTTRPGWRRQQNVKPL